MTDYRQYNVRQAVLRPRKTALLVIDMQRYFHGIASSILDNTLSLVQACAKLDVPVVFTRHGHRDLEIDGGLTN
jgi:nicotinamidase-related amidase